MTFRAGSTIYLQEKALERQMEDKGLEWLM